MKKYYLFSILLISLVYCTDKAQQNKAPYNLVEEGDNTQFNYDNLSPDIIEYGVKSLVSFGKHKILVGRS